MVVTELSSGTARYWACAPNGPSQYPNTRSPTENAVTSRPTASTTPAYSFPRTVARGRRSPVNNLMKKGFAARHAQSVRFTVVARTWTRTSWGPTVGLATSVIRTTSGGPYSVWTAACIPRTVATMPLRPVAGPFEARPHRSTVRR